MSDSSTPEGGERCGGSHCLFRFLCFWNTSSSSGSNGCKDDSIKSLSYYESRVGHIRTRIARMYAGMATSRDTTHEKSSIVSIDKVTLSTHISIHPLRIETTDVFKLYYLQESYLRWKQRSSKLFSNCDVATETNSDDEEDDGDEENDTERECGTIVSEDGKSERKGAKCKDQHRDRKKHTHGNKDEDATEEFLGHFPAGSHAQKFAFVLSRGMNLEAVVQVGMSRVSTTFNDMYDNFYTQFFKLYASWERPNLLKSV